MATGETDSGDDTEGRPAPAGKAASLRPGAGAGAGVVVEHAVKASTIAHLQGPRGMAPHARQFSQTAGWA